MRFCIQALLASALLTLGLFSSSASPGPQTSKPKPDAGPLVVHEWGTFTSFAGSDGVSLEFRTTTGGDLPGFVLDRPRQYELFSQRYKAGDRTFSATKTRTYSFQRMETPVTYFYVDREREVHAAVRFPKGLLTEFYPPVREMMPILHPGKADTVGDSSLVWNNIKLIPQEKASKSIQLPPVKGDDHYAHARETDSAIVRVDEKFLGKSFYEKFLFYRGVGNFQMPVNMVAHGGGRFAITNGGDPLRAAFLVEVKDGQVRFARIAAVGTEAQASLEGAQHGIDALAEAMVRDIVADGMYEREARAMVNTWRSSWFGEDGTRLLYLVPQKLTDTMIPLKIVPEPDQTVRTMVGRLEMLTPEQEAKVAALVLKLASPDGAIRDAAMKDISALGRFAEPTLQRVSRTTQDPEIQTRSRALLKKLQEK